MNFCNNKQIAIGLLALGVGVLVYLVDRPAQQVYFISNDISLFQSGWLMFGALGQSLPSFIHVFSFSILTAGIMNCQSSLCSLVICLVWAIINAAFEIGQHADMALMLVNAIPAWLDGLPVLEHSRSFFVYGTFDVFDLLLGVAGASIAYGLITKTMRRVYE